MSRLKSLRSQLLLLVAGSIVPVLALSFVLGYFVLSHEKASFQEAAMDRNRTFVTAIDAQVQGHIQTLRLLATSPALASGNLAAFHAEARRALETQPDWRNIFVLEPSGQHLVSALHDLDRELPRASDSELDAIALVAKGGQTRIGSLSSGPKGSFYAVPIRTPVVVDGEVKYVLQFILKPEALARLMRAQDYAEEWSVGIVDARGAVIARLPIVEPGSRLAEPFTAAIAERSIGWTRGSTVEGIDSYFAHQTSTVTGWTVGVAIPADQLHGNSYRAARYMLLGGLASLLLAGLFALALARRIERPVALLAQAARGLGQGPNDAIAEAKADAQAAEVLQLALALEEGAKALQERENLREREQNALRAADKAKDEFLAMLGHELRNPLGAITASAHLLRLSKPGAEPATHAHVVIERQARQMTRLVEDLLDVSRLAMGKVTLHLERLDLATLVEHVVSIWQQSGRTRQERRLECNLAACWIEADRDRMEQVLSNLLDNAEKFSPPGKPISIQLSAVEGCAVLEVADEGQGISPDDLPNIFALFMQGKQTIDRPQGGIGLGLSLVRQLVELQGGSVTVASEGHGHGAQFVVKLPLCSPPEHRAVGAPAPATATKGLKVLLVEDNEDSREVMAAMLALQGHSVRSAANGRDGVEAAQAFEPDVALVDIGLPDIDGYEVARRVRKLEMANAPRLVVISGFGQPEDLKRAYEAGFDLHLTKPVAPEFLREVIAALVSARVQSSSPSHSSMLAQLGAPGRPGNDSFGVE
jgi:signal transduction histidine kinase/ActR/RegA family two-component response regulator